MKKSLTITSILISLLFHHQLLAQQRDSLVRFTNGNLLTGNNIQRNIFKKESLQLALFENKYFVVIQFNVLPNNVVKENLKEAGVQLDSYIPGNAYMATIKENFLFENSFLFGITSINILPPAYKINKLLLNYFPDNNKKQIAAIAVSYVSTVKKNTVEKELQNAGAVLISSKYTAINVVFIKVDKNVINAIASLPFVSGISLQILSDEPLNINSRAAHGVSGLNAVNGKNLNGNGVTIGIGDDADISTHTDFAGRLIMRTAALPSNHGTHVAGTTASAGIVNAKYRGMASKATVINQFFSDVITNAPIYVADYNMVLSNNSYYTGQNFCPGDGQYDALSNYIDEQAKAYPQLLHNVAAGNDGSLNCLNFPVSFGTIKSGWQCAKNVLTVGAMNVQDYSIAYFSSRGPVADGRIKPEITANGWAVVSTTTNNNYGINYGTSMSCPAVTGALSLLYERYKQLNAGANPTSALIKALVCNTAEDLGNRGPDYTFGFGMMNARRAVQAIESNHYFINTIDSRNSKSQTIMVPSNSKQLKVMLYWTDMPAAPNAATVLVNDLDLTVKEPSTLLHRPLLLNSTAANVNDIATEGADHINNIEQVVIENPAAGNYTINVEGFSVPFGSQDYVISYEIIKPNITVEYPYGGETFVPGETENIRWSADGNEASTFSIDYSIDNGISWILINNNVAAASRVFSWIVPSIVTKTALVRVSGNSSLLMGKSSFDFGILGQPVVKATNVCEGAVQLNWDAITGATAYDILQLSGDSMKVVGNSVANNFLLLGLDKNTTTWLGVAAKNGNFSGRRSISLSVLPDSGKCTLAAFNGDVKVDSILAPNTARQYFANENNAKAPVQIVIKNLGAVSINNPFNVSYSFGAATITETINPIIAAGGTFTYTFSSAYPIILTGYKYDFKAWVTLAADGNHLNDTAYKTVKFINNDPVSTLPITEGFETMPDINITKQDMAFGENKHLDFFASSTRGRVRTFVNSGFSHTGNRSLTLDQWPYNAITTTDSIILNYNLINYSSGQMRFDFYYKNHGQYNYTGNKIWIRGSENNNWVLAYDIYANQDALGQWKHGLFNINEVLDTALPAQIITKTFQIKIGEEGNISANTPNPSSNNDDGYTFDDLRLEQVVNDLELKTINSPDKSGCGLTANNPISISIKNHNKTDLSNIEVNYQVNGGAVVTEIIPSIAANELLNYSFKKQADLSTYMEHNINVWINFAADSYAVNDSILNYSVHNSPLISSFPYLQNFENSDGDFYTKGSGTSWRWGTPEKLIINKAANGSKAWVTNLTGSYNDNETSYLYSPCFNLSGLKKPVLSFSHILELELNYDFTWIEFSLDGIGWQKLGVSGSGTNWYQEGINNWSFSNKKWHVASIDLPIVSGNIRFRFVLSSDAGVNMEGVGIDDVSIHEKSDVVIASTIKTVTVANVTGNNWVPFYLGDNNVGPYYLLAEINPNGQDLGSVEMSFYPNSTSIVRSSNNQYYLNRNYVVHPTNPPSANVSVRLYFTDAEVDSLIKAKNCITCIKPSSAYELGITKYSGSIAEENGTLDDNITGFYQYILPEKTEIIPHGNGYYAEFAVNSFSEFWFSNGVGNNTQPLPVNLLLFDAIKQSGSVLLNWKIGNEVNVAKYEIERGSEITSLKSISTIAANGNGFYSFTDAQPLIGTNYYRLKIVERNGKFTFSQIKKVNFGNNGDLIFIYPNPIINATLYITSAENCSGCYLYDGTGKLVKNFILHGRNNYINIIGVSKGIYTLKIISEIGTHSKKVFIQ